MLDEMKKKEEEKAGGAAQRADGGQPVEKQLTRQMRREQKTGFQDSVKTQEGVCIKLDRLCED